jgi:hypothetical protein
MRELDPKYLECVYIDVRKNIGRLEQQGRFREAKAFYSVYATEIEIFRRNGLLVDNASALSGPIENVIIHYKDFTTEGLKFLMSGALDNWLKNCDRKSNALFKKGASEEERLAVSADISSLQKRLDKFRSQQVKKLH